METEGSFYQNAGFKRKEEIWRLGLYGG